VIVIVSAMSGETNNLVGYVNEPRHSSMHANTTPFVSSGEIVTLG
jgi:hypothetical protein